MRAEAMRGKCESESADLRIIRKPLRYSMQLPQSICMHDVQPQTDKFEWDGSSLRCLLKAQHLLLIITSYHRARTTLDARSQGISGVRPVMAGNAIPKPISEFMSCSQLSVRHLRLHKLPAELLQLVADELDLTDLASFRLTCIRFFDFTTSRGQKNTHWLPVSETRCEGLTLEDWACVSRFADSRRMQAWRKPKSAEVPLALATFQGCVPMMLLIISAVDFESWHDKSLSRIFSILLDISIIRGDTVIIKKVTDLLEKFLNHNWHAKVFHSEDVLKTILCMRMSQRRVVWAAILQLDNAIDVLVCMAGSSILPNLRHDACCIAACSPNPGLLKQVVDRVLESLNVHEAEIFISDTFTPWMLPAINDCLEKQLDVCHTGRPSCIPRLSYWESEIIKTPSNLYESLRNLQISLHHGDTLTCGSSDPALGTFDQCHHPNLVDFVQMWTLEDKVDYINGVLSDSRYHPAKFHDMDMMQVILAGDAYQLNLSGLYAAFTKVNKWAVIEIITSEMQKHQVRIRSEFSQCSRKSMASLGSANLGRPRGTRCRKSKRTMSSRS